MLVLSRKKGESIVIGKEVIKLTVVEIRGDKVRIGIDAPRDITIHREEVADAIAKALLIKDESTNPEDVDQLAAPPTC